MVRTTPEFFVAPVFGRIAIRPTVYRIPSPQISLSIPPLILYIFRYEKINMYERRLSAAYLHAVPLGLIAAELWGRV